MRRIACALAVLSATITCTATANAWVPVASYDVPDGGVATCLRDAGSGQVTLFGARTGRVSRMDVLRPDAGTFAAVGSTTLGGLSACPTVAPDGGATMASDVVTGPAPKGSRFPLSEMRVAAMGETPQTVANTSRAFTAGPALAVNGAGAAVIAWPEVSADPEAMADGATVKVAIRPAGSATFGPVQTLATNAESASSSVVAGIDGSGRASVAWVSRSGGVLAVSSDASGTGFGAPQALGITATSGLAIAVTADGRAMVAALSRQPQIYERAPGADAFAAVKPPPGTEAAAGEQVAVALDERGDAVVAVTDGAGSTLASVRPAGGTFAAWKQLGVAPTSPTAEDDGSVGQLSFLGDGEGLDVPRIPPDDEGDDISIAIGPDGAIAVAWTVTDATGMTSGRAAAGTIAGGIGAGSRVGNPCAPLNGIRALVLADGSVGVALADNATSISAVGSTWATGGGRLRLVRPGQPAATTIRPRVSVALANRRPLRIGDALVLRVRCARGPCGVRATATLREVRSPWSHEPSPDLSELPPEIEARRRLLLHASASATTSAGAGTRLRLRGLAGAAFVVPETTGRTRLNLIACTPDGSSSTRVALQPRLRGGALRPMPKIVRAKATRHGRTTRVTVRLDRPLHGEMTVLGQPLTPQSFPDRVETLRGRGRSVLHTTLAGPGKPVRKVTLQLTNADALDGPMRTLKVR